jgi:hypothetical protein
VKVDVILDIKFHVDEGDEKAQTERGRGEGMDVRERK